MATPAEFPRIDPVRSTLVPDAVVRSREAESSDFGAAQGLNGLARGIGEVGNVAQNIADDQARTWAATAASQQELNVRQAWQDKVNSLDPNAQDYPEQIANLTQTAAQTFDDAADQVKGNAPNGFATKLLDQHFTQAKARFQLEAMGQQAQLNAAYTSNLVQQGISADTDLVSASPDNDTFVRTAAKWQATIGAYKSIDPSAKAKLQDYARNQLANAQASGAVSQNPGGFLAAISPQGGITTQRGEAGQVPAIQNFNANFVKPFSADQVQNTAQLVRAPSPYDKFIDADAQKYGISRDLLKTILVDESHLNPKADNGISHGIAQLTSDTAKRLGVDPTNPEASIDGAARLLSQYQDKYGGDPYKLALAYYGGPNAGSQGPNSKQYAANITATLTYMGAGGEPQVQPIPEQAIASAKPQLAGWDDLTWSEKVGYVRKAEAQQGKALSEARGRLTSGLQDSLATLKQGVTPPDINDPMYSKDNMVAVLGADRGQRAYTELNFAKQTAGNMQQLATMPKAQRDQLVATTHATAAGVGAAGNFTMAHNLAEANARIDAQIKADPINYAISSKINGEAPLDLSNDANAVKSFARRQQTNAIMVQEQGAKPAIFSSSEAQQYSEQFAKSTPDQQAQFLVNMRRGLSDPAAFQTGLNQLSKNNTALGYGANLLFQQGSVHAGDAQQTGWQVGRMVLEGNAILNGAAFTGEKGKPGSDDPSLPKGRTAAPFTMTQFAKAFDSALGANAFQFGNAAVAAQARAVSMQAAAAYFAADAKHTGLDTSDLSTAAAKATIAKAATAVLGEQWKGAPNGGSLFAPWGMSMQQFQDQWATRAKAAFATSGFAPSQQAAFMKQATPVNAGDGRYQFMWKGQTVNMPGTNRPVTVRYSDPLPQLQPQDEQTGPFGLPVGG